MATVELVASAFACRQNVNPQLTSDRHPRGMARCVGDGSPIRHLSLQQQVKYRRRGAIKTVLQQMHRFHAQRPTGDSDTGYRGNDMRVQFLNIRRHQRQLTGYLHANVFQDPPNARRH